MFLLLDTQERHKNFVSDPNIKGVPKKHLRFGRQPWRLGLGLSSFRDVVSGKGLLMHYEILQLPLLEVTTS